MGQSSSGESRSNNHPGGVVGSAGAIIVCGEVNNLTVTELALKIYP